MGDPSDLSDFDEVCRLFPLPQVVHFPYAVLRLHIFEPRYRQMTEDALTSGDKLITMVQMRPPGAPAPRGLGTPAIEEVACLGRILQHHRLPDGRFNLLLLGLKRVRLIEELPGDTLYRRARAEILEDQGIDREDDPRREAIETHFRRVLAKAGTLDPDLAAMLDGGVPLGALTDLVAHGIALPAEVKQALLDETRVDRRADRLLEILAQLPSLGEEPDAPSRPFPPPFSAN